MIIFSKNKTAEIFGVDRMTLYGWCRRDLPSVDAPGPGRPAALNFHEVLRWRSAAVTRLGWTPEDIAAMAQQARARMKSLKKGDRHGTRQ